LDDFSCDGNSEPFGDDVVLGKRKKNENRYFEMNVLKEYRNKLKAVINTKKPRRS